MKRWDQDTSLMAHTSLFRSAGSPVPVVPAAALITPPCSPASPGSPGHQEELSRDLLMDVYGCTDQLLLSPEGSPSYLSYLEAVPACLLPAPHAAGPNQTADLAPPAATSPPCHLRAGTPDAGVVPDCLSMSDMCDVSLDCALHQDDFSLVEPPPEGSPIQAQHVPLQVFPRLPSLPPSRQSPSSAESGRYNEREQVEISILAQQISCLASSFSRHPPLEPVGDTNQTSGWPNQPAAQHCKSDQILDDGVFDLILGDLDLVAQVKSGSRFQQGLPAEPLAVLEAFTPPLGHHDRHSGLHQLNHCIPGSLHAGNHVTD